MITDPLEQPLLDVHLHHIKLPSLLQLVAKLLQQNQQYYGDIVISTNYGSNIEIPIILNVNDFSGILGDVNSDQQINIQDVVLLVGYILNETEYINNGDMNQDGVLDVIDIVQLVGVILN